MMKMIIHGITVLRRTLLFILLGILGMEISSSSLEVHFKVTSKNNKKQRSKPQISHNSHYLISVHIARPKGISKENHRAIKSMLSQIN